MYAQKGKMSQISGQEAEKVWELLCEKSVSSLVYCSCSAEEKCFLDCTVSSIKSVMDILSKIVATLHLGWILV